MEFKQKFNLDIWLHIEVTHYRPGRSAPPCSNPSHAAYSDPGDDVELEFKLYIIDMHDIKHELPAFLDYLYLELFDDILDYVENDLLVD